ncbi:Protein Y51H7BR.8 [Aphelenchoides avenae]|nr:Protein Y51H7BR.8 [Aphelenchus avenae]
MSMAESSAGSSSGEHANWRNVDPPPNELHFPLYIRLSRLLFGRIKRLPRSMNTTLVLFTIHMYLTVPVIVAAGIAPDLRALLRPFRIIHDMGFQFEELRQYKDLL